MSVESMKIMRKIAVLVVILLTSGIANADQQLCKQLGHLGYIIARYRDRGIDELETTEVYLAMMRPYQEQSIVLALIDRVYNRERDLWPHEISNAEQDLCLINITQQYLSSR